MAPEERQITDASWPHIFISQKNILNTNLQTEIPLSDGALKIQIYFFKKTFVMHNILKNYYELSYC